MRSYFKDGQRIKRRRQTSFDTIICAARRDGFVSVFLQQRKWGPVQIAEASVDKLLHIAIYQVRPISAITHIAKVKKIVRTPDNHCFVILNGAPMKLKIPIGLGKNPHLKPQRPKFALFSKLIGAKNLDDVFVE